MPTIPESAFFSVSNRLGILRRVISEGIDASSYLKRYYGKILGKTSPIVAKLLAEDLALIGFYYHECNGHSFPDEDKFEKEVRRVIKGEAKKEPVASELSSVPDSTTATTEEQEPSSYVVPTVLSSELPKPEVTTEPPHEEQPKLFVSEERGFMLSVMVYLFIRRFNVTENSEIGDRMVDSIQSIEPKITYNQIVRFVTFLRENYKKHMGPEEYEDDIPF